MEEIFDFSLLEKNSGENLISLVVKNVTLLFDRLINTIIGLSLFIFRFEFLKIFKKESWKSSFVNWFGFEIGISDVFNEAMLLERKNYVIKKIIFISNILFALMITISGLDQLLIVTIIISVISLTLSNRINKLMKNDDRGYIKQQVIQYLWSVYILFISGAVYIKLKTSSQILSENRIADLLKSGSTNLNDFLSITIYESLSQVGYLVIFYALVVIALYQDKVLLRRTYLFTFVGVFVMHITLTYNITNLVSNFSDLFQLLNDSIGLYVLLDLLLRTSALGIFMIVLYGIVVMNEMLDKKRKEELTKRTELESEFRDVVDDVIDVIEVYKNTNLFESVTDCYRVGEMAKVLAGLLGIEPDKQIELFEYAICHTSDDYKTKINHDDINISESDYDTIKEKTKIGSKVIKRLHLNQKCENIVRAQIEGWINPKFIKNMKSIQNNIYSDIILLVDMYDTLRSNRPYKKEMTHPMAVQLINEVFEGFFKKQLLERFMKYNQTFDKMFKELI